MIALDTNLLVYAHREDAPWHDRASAVVTRLAEGRGAWAIPWPAIHEFLAVVTHPRVFVPPTPLGRAIEQVNAWMESPTLVLLGETGEYWPHLRDAIEQGRVAGGMVHDARIAALCVTNGVDELLTADRDFGRFPDLKTRNPLIGA